LNKKLKNKLTVHAELNCIINATDTIGWTLYVTKPPCIKCAAAIIQAKIATIVCPALDSNSSWFLDQKEAQIILMESRTVIIIAK
jgi:deoxycytidylate deaminase